MNVERCYGKAHFFAAEAAKLLCPPDTISKMRQKLELHKSIVRCDVSFRAVVTLNSQSIVR